MLTYLTADCGLSLGAGLTLTLVGLAGLGLAALGWWVMFRAGKLR